MTDQTTNFDADQINDPHIIADDHDDDQRWIANIKASLPRRSREAQQALIKALLDDDGSGALLGTRFLDLENVRGTFSQKSPERQRRGTFTV